MEEKRKNKMASEKYTYKKIVSKAKSCKENVETNYKLGVSTMWTYYFCKAILKPKTNFKKIEYTKAPKPSGTYISRQISQTDYTKLAKYIVKFVEKNKRLPNYLTWGAYKIRPSVYTYAFSRILVYYEKNGKLPLQVKVNSKCFTKPKEYKNDVYSYFVKKTGKEFKTIDDLLAYVQSHYRYQYYYDDHKSNKQVIDEESGNCTDLLQFLCNMVEEMGYSWKCIHVKCRSSGSGHVFGKFKHPKNTGGEWITRDIACVADGGAVNCVWCSNGYLLAENPSWWLANLHR